MTGKKLLPRRKPIWQERTSLVEQRKKVWSIKKVLLMHNFLKCIISSMWNGAQKHLSAALPNDLFLWHGIRKKLGAAECFLLRRLKRKVEFLFLSLKWPHSHCYKTPETLKVKLRSPRPFAIFLNLRASRDLNLRVVTDIISLLLLLHQDGGEASRR